MTAWGVVLAVAGGIFLSTVTGCGAAQEPYADYPPECRLPALAKIQAAYASELLWACKDYPDLDGCPNAGIIDERYQVKFDAWEECNHKAGE